MRYSIRTVTAANEIPLPFDLAEAFKHLEVPELADDPAEQINVEGLLRTAMDAVERFTSQVLTPRLMEISLGGFPAVPELISIPRDPVTGVTAIAYTDVDGAAVDLTVADWRWSESAADVVMPAFRASWPRAATELGAVRIRFEAGYDVGLAPASLIGAVKLTLGHLFANREGGDMPEGAIRLCRPLRRITL
ncbi:hypothetical protein [Sphingosinicella sp. BN140058]|uniref:head-tail connector protein n=1 Tax=Sphingosinicella sp. BN140058 TaxID=1892855 RepID=UPI001012D0B2|nr:hypothetical protein [Sphingosinicella sp. BN140058]QAY77919.1 hypothetical protein ETR14_16365 [Sphingosinicella sp. BN140058]